MASRPPFQLQLEAPAQPVLRGKPLRSLVELTRALRRAAQYAEQLANEQPPWLRRTLAAAPSLWLEADGIRVLYRLDLGSRTIVIEDVEPSTRAARARPRV